MATCPFCQSTVKLTEIIRSAHHDLGCVNCFGKPQAETPVMAAERIAARPVARPFTLAR